MKDPSSSVRYLGFRSIAGGGRLLDFSFTGPSESIVSISVAVPFDLLFGGDRHDRLSVQECAAVCYETLKGRLVESHGTLPSTFKLTSADVLQHRKPGKIPGRR
jgi:hypothetical protein